MPPLIQHALQAYRVKMARRFGARLRGVRLFGSYARGEAHEHSDIDVAVLVEGLTRQEWQEAVGDVVEVDLETGVSLSPFVISSERFEELLQRERRIARDILEEGVAV